MTKRKGQKDKQRNDQKKRTERKTTQWPKRKGLFFCPFSFGHGVACPSVIFFWSLCCLFFCPFLLVIVTITKKKGQKDKQHNGQKEN
jgi:hypothetical protein